MSDQFNDIIMSNALTLISEKAVKAFRVIGAGNAAIEHLEAQVDQLIKTNADAESCSSFIGDITNELNLVLDSNPAYRIITLISMALEKNMVVDSLHEAVIILSGIAHDESLQEITETLREAAHNALREPISEDEAAAGLAEAINSFAFRTKLLRSMENPPKEILARADHLEVHVTLLLMAPSFLSVMRDLSNIEPCEQRDETVRFLGRRIVEILDARDTEANLAIDFLEELSRHNPDRTDREDSAEN